MSAKLDEVVPEVQSDEELPAEYHGLTNDSRAVASDQSLASLDATKELLIEGRVYDVEHFIKRHPGGSVIKLQLGTDASDAFRAFHLRSAKAHKMLRTLPSRAVETGYEADALSRDFEELRLALLAEGYFEPDPAHVAYRFAEVLAMYAAGFALIWAGWWCAHPDPDPNPNPNPNPNPKPDPNPNPRPEPRQVDGCRRRRPRAGPVRLAAARGRPLLAHGQHPARPPPAGEP
jgi:hypothetical protein